MGYYNVFLQYGMDKLIETSKKIGIKANGVELDLAGMMKFKDSVVEVSFGSPFTTMIQPAVVVNTTAAMLVVTMQRHSLRQLSQT